MRCAFGQTNGGICTGAIIPNNWNTAITTCSSLGLAGKSWRLSNRNEIFSLLDFTQNAAPAINVSFLLQEHQLQTHGLQQQQQALLHLLADLLETVQLEAIKPMEKW